MMQTDREYAEALFMLSEENGEYGKYLEELRDVKKIIGENPEYIEFLSSPSVSLEERLQAIDEAFGADLSEYSLSFIKLLCENGRIRYLINSIEEFERLVMASSGKASATVFSAAQLSENQKQALQSKLKKLTGKETEAAYVIDPSLIGGLKIETEGKIYDGSLKTRLKNVKDMISDEQT